MRLSSNGRALIQSFEGLSLTAYPDAGGYSIGYGHFGATPGQTITREEAERLFAQDLIKYEAAVSLTTLHATQNQFDAMVSLAYNVGTAGFSGSTVARLHNMGDFSGAADAFRMWNKSRGSVNQTLVARREKERGVYLAGYGYQTPPSGQPEPSPTHFPSPAPVQSTPFWPELPSSVPPVPPILPSALLLTLLGGLGWTVWALLRK